MLADLQQPANVLSPMGVQSWSSECLNVSFASLLVSFASLLENLLLINLAAFYGENLLAIRYLWCLTDLRLFGSVKLRNQRDTEYRSCPKSKLTPN